MSEYNSSAFKVALDSIPSNVVIYRYSDNDFIFQDINNMTMKTENLKKEDVVGKYLSKVFPGVKDFGLFDVLMDVYNSGQSQTHHQILYKDDRSSGWRENKVSKLPNGDLFVMYENQTEQKYFKDENAKNILRLEAAQKMAYLGSWDWDLLTNKAAWSDETYRILGEEAQSFQSSFECFISYVHPDDAAKMQEYATRIIESKEEENVHYRIVRKDGEIRYIHSSGRAEYNDKGEAVFMAGIMLDVTEKTLYEIQSQKRYKVMQEHQETLQKLADQGMENAEKAISHLTVAEEVANLGTWEWNIQTDEVTWSDQAFRIFGEVPQSFPVTREIFFSFIPEDEIAKVQAAIQNSIQGYKGESNSVKYEVKHSIILKNSEKKYIQGWGRTYFSETGEPLRITGALLDISQEEFLRDELLQQKEIYEKLFHNASDGVALLSDGLILDCNDTFVQMLGYDSKDALLNLSLTEFSPKFQPDGESSAVRIEEKKKMLLAEGTQHFEWMHVKADGSPLWCDKLLTAISMNGKKITYVVTRDISDRKAMEEELKLLTHDLQVKVDEGVKKNKAQTILMLQQSRLAQIGEMISMIAHQWRQPLNTLTLILQKMELFHERGMLDDEKIETNISSSIQVINSMSHTIDDFRNFFKENKNREEAPVAAIIDTCLQIIGFSLENKDIGIEIDVDDDICVKSYINEIQQVILNILKNAEDIFAEESISDANIKIKAYTTKKYTCISIEDNAGGVPLKLMDKIFDPYFSTKTDKDGTGLGLYMSKTIIEDHCGGKLVLKNIENGACFTLKLPLI